MLTKNEVAEIRADAEYDNAWAVQLCDSHEALRARVETLEQERSYLVNRVRSQIFSASSRTGSGFGKYPMGAEDVLRSVVSLLRDEELVRLFNDFNRKMWPESPKPIEALSV